MNPLYFNLINFKFNCFPDDDDSDDFEFSDTSSDDADYNEDYEWICCDNGKIIFIKNKK